MKSKLQSAVTSLTPIVIVALAVRLAFFWSYQHNNPKQALATIPFLFESGNIAHSIATGHGFGSPFHVDTGPTAWMTPVYPCLLAGIFRVFGEYTFQAFTRRRSLKHPCNGVRVRSNLLRRKTSGRRWSRRHGRLAVGRLPKCVSDSHRKHVGRIDCSAARRHHRLGNAPAPRISTRHCVDWLRAPVGPHPDDQRDAGFPAAAVARLARLSEAQARHPLAGEAVARGRHGGAVLPSLDRAQLRSVPHLRAAAFDPGPAVVGRQQSRRPGPLARHAPPDS